MTNIFKKTFNVFKSCSSHRRTWGSRSSLDYWKSDGLKTTRSTSFSQLILFFLMVSYIRDLVLSAGARSSFSAGWTRTRWTTCPRRSSSRPPPCCPRRRSYSGRPNTDLQRQLWLRCPLTSVHIAFHHSFSSRWPPQPCPLRCSEYMLRMTLSYNHLNRTSLSVIQSNLELVLCWQRWISCGSHLEFGC